MMIINKVMLGLLERGYEHLHLYQLQIQKEYD